MNRIKLCLIALLLAGCAAEPTTVDAPSSPELEAPASCDLEPTPGLCAVCYQVKRYGCGDYEFSTRSGTTFTCAPENKADCVTACCELEAEQGAPALNAGDVAVSGNAR